MLNPERIPIGKLKQAYELSALEIDELLAALWPNGVFPYELWEKAYTSYWKDAGLHNAVFHLAGAVPALPDIDQKLSEIYETTPFYPYRTLLVKFFEELSRKLFVSDLKKGFYYITEEAIDGNTDEFKDKIEYIFSRLSMAEDDCDLRIFPPYHWATNMTGERFQELMNTKILSVPSSCYFFLADMFTDTIIVDKAAAIRHLFECGYSLRQEVKGISHAIVERITATPAAQEQATPADQKQDAPAEPLSKPLRAPFAIPRELWEGKAHDAVLEAMREKKYSAAIIAHVLFHWCDLKNKTEIGRLLSDSEQEDSTYYHRADRLLKKASALTIISV
jgi:hypothetical protein